MTILFRLAAPVVATTLFVLSADLYGQTIAELEPNDSCFEPQPVASAELPVNVTGSLDSTDGFADIDYYRFSRPAGDEVQVDLEGAATGLGTLGDPLVGVFDAACNAIAVDDDGGAGVNSRVVLTVPDNGLFVVAATAFPDFGFVGGGNGSYRLRVDHVREAEAIEGRVVDAETGAPLTGVDFPFASVVLFGCDLFGCGQFAGFQSPGIDGRFRFDAATNGLPLQAGFYQLRVNAIGYVENLTAEFLAAEDVVTDIGDVALAPLSFIGTLTGRLIDATDGMPLTGFGPPFAVVELQRCDFGSCFAVVAILPDLDGRFTLEGVLYQLPPGDYRLVGRAEDYLPGESAIVAIGANEDVEFGDFGLLPQPIQLGAVTPCEIVHPSGICRYSIEIRNRGATRFRGVAWSVIEYFGAGPAPVFTRFQVGEKGVTDATPRKLSIDAGQDALLNFGVRVPSSVPVGSTICASISIGQMPGSVFQPVGERFAFCALKGSTRFDVLPDKTGRRLYDELRADRVPVQRSAR